MHVFEVQASFSSPWGTFVPNFVSFTASIAELIRGDTSRTQPITHAPYLMTQELEVLALQNDVHIKELL